MTCDPRFAQRAQNLVAVGFRQHEIEDEEIDTRLLRTLQARRAIVRKLHGVSLHLEIVLQSRGEVPVVLDDQNVHRLV